LEADRFASPDLYPAAFDISTERTRFIGLDEARYRRESFLDERIVAGGEQETWIGWPQVYEASRRHGNECDFIFHIGHVGSTLLSRLLGHHSRVFSLREPAILRTLARSELSLDRRRVAAWTEVFLRFWGRVYRPEQRTLLKTTSLVSEMAPLMMQISPSASGILMFVSPRAYLAGILSSEGSRAEARLKMPTQLARLNRRLGGAAWRADELAEGEVAALSWLSEVSSLAEVAAAFPQRVLWIDFEAFLSRPGDGVADALQRLHGGAAPEDVAAILQSPDLTRYSKAQEFAYDAGLRRRVLAQAESEHAAEIARGIRWLDAAGSAHPVLAQAMRQVAAARLA
jgi:hypothetical protein